MAVATRHVRIWKHVQEWTRVYNPTGPMAVATGHKPHPCVFISLPFILRMALNAHA